MTAMPVDPDQLNAFVERTHARHSNLDMSFFMTGQEREFSLVALDTFYVPLRIAGRPPDLEQQGSERAAQADILSTQLLDPAHGLGPRLALLGDAGCGKTTILRHLTGELARAWLAPDDRRLRERTGLAGENLVPIFIPLRHYHHFCTAQAGRAISLRSFHDFLAAYFTNLDDLAFPAVFYRALIESGRCLLALDGFDEIPGELQRRQILNVVRDLAAVAGNIVILSSRVAAYGGSTQLGGHFQTLWVQNLNRDERRAQIEKWVDGIRPLTARDLKAEDILRRMPEGSPLDTLAVTPMIVTALCVVYFYDHELPEQRARLYRRCVDIMLYEKLRPDEPGTLLAGLAGAPDFKRELLARLAFALHESGLEAADRERAAAWLKDGFKSEAEAARLPAARRFLDTITVRGNLLQERDGAFGFGRQHLTFQEFLAGYHLSLNLRPRQRRALWPALLLSDRWREPIRLAVGATLPDNVVACESVLEELLEQAQSDAAAPALVLAGYQLAAESLLDLGEKGRRRIELDLQRDVIDGLARCLVDPAVAGPAAGLLAERVAAGAALGRLGDPREGVATLPPLLTARLEGAFQFSEQAEPRTVAPFRRAFTRSPMRSTRTSWRTAATRTRAGGATPVGSGGRANRATVGSR